MYEKLRKIKEKLRKFWIFKHIFPFENANTVKQNEAAGSRKVSQEKIAKIHKNS